ncbi:MAG: 4'-phosphopantetheinyl transferase superfamily protein [Ignavibacteriales bacterium]|nr:4'-phosphopantetheinyl transferase superfamily protein [Ignavibacteriales bacterium]
MIKGIGVDIVGINRFKEIMNNPDFIEQILTRKEISEIPAGGRNDVHLAAVFAFKEAVMKALGCELTQGSYWHDVVVAQDWIIHLAGIFKKIADDRSIIKIHSSHSISKNYIVALVLLEG